MTTEQRTNLKLKLLQDVYGDDTMSRARVFEWHRRFKQGKEDVEDDPRSGRPATSTTEENVKIVRQKVLGYRRLTVRMIANELNKNCERVCTIITKHLRMRKMCAKMVPRLLNEEQKERHRQVCHDILEELETEPNLLGSVITGDESWIFEYDQETKRQSLQWKSPTSPRPKKARKSKSKFKVMLIAFFDVRGIVHTEFMPQGHTINQHIYRDVLRRLMLPNQEDLNPGNFTFQSKRAMYQDPALHPLRMLSPVLVQGILRVGGRLQRAELPDETTAISKSLRPVFQI